MEGPRSRRPEPSSWTTLGPPQTDCGRSSCGSARELLLPPALWLAAGGGAVAREQDPGQSLGLR